MEAALHTSSYLTHTTCSSRCCSSATCARTIFKISSSGSSSSSSSSSIGVTHRNRRNSHSSIGSSSSKGQHFICRAQVHHHRQPYRQQQQQQQQQRQHLQSVRHRSARSSASSASVEAAAAAAAAAPAALMSHEDTSANINLGTIRSALIRQEDTIIFTLIERAQFARNPPVYIPDGAIPVPQHNSATQGAAAAGGEPPPARISLLEFVLRETEQLHGRMRRYTSPDEHAFYPADLPPPTLPPLAYPQLLAAPAADAINVNGAVMDAYLRTILPAITSPGDDNNYGSASTLDVLCLQALSKRIHYGKFVAEAKFREAREEYSKHIRTQDSRALMQLLTNEAIEKAVVERVKRKAAIFGRDVEQEDSENDGLVFKVQPEIVAKVYAEIVMPLTKEVQVAYLLRRLDGDEEF